MHEMGIAKNILDIVKEEICLLKNNPIVGIVYFKTTVINAIYPESLKFFFDALKVDYPPLENATLNIEVLPAKGHCKNCNKDYYTMELYYLCEACKQPVDLEITDYMTVDSIHIN